MMNFNQIETQLNGQNQLEKLSEKQTEDLLLYFEILKKWREHINLISKKITDKELWQRHILDCLRIIPILAGYIKISPKPYGVDLGSGNGLPGIIIAIVRRNIRIGLIESRGKKCAFLQHVIMRLKLDNAKLYHTRIENWYQKFDGLEIDFITARALAPLDKLLDYANPLCQKKTIGIFFCGNNKKYSQINDAKKKFIFDYKSYQKKSENKNTGPIIVIQNLEKLTQKNLAALTK